MFRKSLARHTALLVSFKSSLVEILVALRHMQILFFAGSIIILNGEGSVFNLNVLVYGVSIFNLILL